MTQKNHRMSHRRRLARAALRRQWKEHLASLSTKEEEKKAMAVARKAAQ